MKDEAVDTEETAAAAAAPGRVELQLAESMSASFRSSLQSARLYGPAVSCRIGRPDHLQSLLTAVKHPTSAAEAATIMTPNEHEPDEEEGRNQPYQRERLRVLASSLYRGCSGAVVDDHHHSNHSNHLTFTDEEAKAEEAVKFDDINNNYDDDDDNNNNYNTVDDVDDNHKKSNGKDQPQTITVETDAHQQLFQQQRHPTPSSSITTSAWTPLGRSLGAGPEQPTPSSQDVVVTSDLLSPSQRQHQLQALRRLSLLTEQQQQLQPPNYRNKYLVQIKLKHVSYHVPVQMDAPSKRTVINQSICYFAYEFFKRLSDYCTFQQETRRQSRRLKQQQQRPSWPVKAPLHDDDHNHDNHHQNPPQPWVPTDLSDLIVPYAKVDILHDINLVFSPGQCYLILGPPASGKTTLLQAIAGRLPAVQAGNSSYTGNNDNNNNNNNNGGGGGGKRKKKQQQQRLVQKQQAQITGRIEYNECTTREHPELVLPNIVSFVGQLDIHAPYLTVKETFDFAYQCRTGKGGLDDGDGDNSNDLGPASPKQVHSENLTISGLGLAHVADTFVGNADVRGVSGGQRRRVTVGEMMQGQTPVACADEISTGLDAAVTYDICKSIVEFSKAMRTTRIVSLLQPGPETFALFDQVVVLSEGYVVYAGPVEEVVDYFARLGYRLPATMDVADFLQSVTTADGALLFDVDTSPYDHHLSSQEFAAAFSNSRQAARIRDELDGDSRYSWNDPTAHGAAVIPKQFSIRYQNTWIQAATLNFQRHLTLWWRDKGFLIGKMFENIGMAVATGGILFGKAVIPAGLIPADNPPTQTQVIAFQTIQDGVYAALFMTCLHILLGTTTSAPDDIDGRPIHYKHGDANFYQTSAFVFGRLVSTLPQRALEICSFGIPLYWMVGLDPTAPSFLLFLAVVLTYTFGLKMLYGIIAQILPNKANVLGFGTFLVLLFSLFSGFIVFPGTIPLYFKWLYYANPMSWAFQSLLFIEFSSAKYDNLVSDSTSITGLDLFLASRGFPIVGNWATLGFAFLVPYIFICAAILCVVLQHVRIQPTRNTPVKRGNGVNDNLTKDDFNLPFTPVDLTFEDVVYEVKASTANETLRLLNKVNGIFSAGRMCALMGSSGAGKTTLMDVIALRKTSGTITGEVRLNGFFQDRVSFLRCSGYVEQFDVQQAELTVRETVVFSARLRLDSKNPITATDKGKLRFADYVLDMLELTDIKDLQVGSYAEGGLSFEQRKRLAIAVELAASPSIIFLDEPTSGLDSRGALVIMRAMKAIANTQRTVVSTIHQPSAAVFEMFDDLLLLKRGGEVVFFGELGNESCHLVDYFESHGAQPIDHGENPAAWMLRAYTGEHENFNWKDAYEASEQFRVMKATIEKIKQSTDESKRIKYDTEFAASIWKHMELMNRRIFRIMMRAPSYNLARLMIAILYAFLIGCVFIRTRTVDKVFNENDVSGIISTIFLGLIIMGVVSISMAVPVMKEIRDVFYKHRASGMLDHNSVTVAITLAEIPYIVMISAIFSAVYYSVVGLFVSADKWFAYFGYFSLNLACYVYFGQAFICLVKDIPTAGALVGALIGYNVFFSGLIVKPQYFVGPFQLGYWTAPGRFAFEGMIVSQFIDLEYVVIPEENSPYFYFLNCTPATLRTSTCHGTMTEFVDFFFDGKFTVSHRPIDVGVLFFCLFLARLLCWVALKYFNYVNT